MADDVLAALRSYKYINLATYRRNGQEVLTPLWFAEKDGRVYAMTRSDSWKYKRMRNNPRVWMAPSTMRGRILGPKIEAVARILPPEEWLAARELLCRKYWLMRLPWLWSKHNVFVEFVPTA